MIGIAQPIVTMSEAQSYVRVETGEEEAILAGLVRTASGLCEAFLNQVVVAREFSCDIPASGAWERVPVTPVRSITNVERIGEGGVPDPLAASDYMLDVDASGDGWVRLSGVPTASLIRATGTAGMAIDQNEVPEPIRQGVLRLVAHLFTARDGAGGDPPAAVTALWRPYRRMRLS